MSDFVDESNMDLFIVRKKKEYTGAILRILEPFKRGNIKVEVVYNPFGLRRFQEIYFLDLYPVISRRDDSDPNLALIFQHFEAYRKVSAVDTSRGFIPTLEMGHVFFGMKFRLNLFDVQKIHLLDGKVMFWSMYQAYSPEGIKELTQFANQLGKDLDFDIELRAYNSQSLGFTPRNVKYFLDNKWVLENGFWQNKHNNLWPPEKPYEWPKKEYKPRPRKKKETPNGQIPGSSGS